MLLILVIDDSLSTIQFAPSWKLESNHEAKLMESSSEEEGK